MQNIALPADLDAHKSGSFKIGGEIEIHRLGFGAMRITGPTPSQIALAWLLKRSPVMVPIPGTSKVAHLEENVAAVEIRLSDEEFATLDREGRAK